MLRRSPAIRAGKRAIFSRSEYVLLKAIFITNSVENRIERLLAEQAFFFGF